jgi:hypothetical protein
MPRRAQPVPPIFQPEVAARAIYHAAHHYRREWNVGWITDVVLSGNAVLPGVGDHYLAANGFESQMTSEPERPGRADNLYEPLPGDYGAHGRFDSRSAASSPQLWFTQNRGMVLAGLGLVALAAIAGLSSSASAGGNRLA